MHSELYCLFASYLPSLQQALSDVTDLIRRGTSAKVLEPSKCARQTAPLPDNEKHDLNLFAG